MPIMDIIPYDLHQRVPLFIGHADLVDKAVEFISDYDGEWIEIYQQHRDQSVVASPLG
jgi:hypothetical protein